MLNEPRQRVTTYPGTGQVVKTFVFFEKVGCHDPPRLPILSNSHEVLVSHSRPCCDVCQPLRSWPSFV